MCDSHRKKREKKTRVHAVAIKVTYAFSRKRNTHTQNTFNLSPVCTAYAVMPSIFNILLNFLPWTV